MKQQKITAGPATEQKEKNTMSKRKVSLRTLAPLVAAAIIGISSTSPALALEGKPTQPPGFDFVSTLIGWALYIAAFVLFIYFIIGIVHAAKARRHGDEEVTAPLWPLLGGAALGIVGLIWQTVVGV